MLSLVSLLVSFSVSLFSSLLAISPFISCLRCFFHFLSLRRYHIFAIFVFHDIISFALHTFSKRPYAFALLWRNSHVDAAVARE